MPGLRRARTRPRTGKRPLCSPNCAEPFVLLRSRHNEALIRLVLHDDQRAFVGDGAQVVVEGAHLHHMFAVLGAARIPIVSVRLDVLLRDRAAIHPMYSTNSIGSGSSGGSRACKCSTPDTGARCSCRARAMHCAVYACPSAAMRSWSCCCCSLFVVCCLLSHWSSRARVSCFLFPVPCSLVCCLPLLSR